MDKPCQSILIYGILLKVAFVGSYSYNPSLLCEGIKEPIVDVYETDSFLSMNSIPVVKLIDPKRHGFLIPRVWC